MYQPIIGTLGFVLSKDHKKVLLVHRNKRKSDHQLGKYNGLGGKLETHEDVLQGMKREILEEAGIDCTDIVLRGTVNWPGFGPNGEHWLGFVFLIKEFSGTPFTSNHEGDLVWVDVLDISNLSMWEGDKYFIPLVLDADPRPFHAYIPYKNGKVVDFSFTR
ncbi:MAG: 8-oxo-dGTP diphosphatase [Chlamydiae bacterium]|nr:8-oxo-dGTP diphosphatase [Chlamydiota bacterium]